MEQKISFSVESAQVLQENPNSNFAVLSLDFFASGENLHNMYVSEETLMRTADTIRNCPLVWKYDEQLDDVYTHDKDEVPCGFVPETSNIKSRILPDGRTMLSVVAYVWKRYTGALLEIFKRDGGRKPVSVEMSVFNTQELPNGLLELTDFRYEGITVLGSFVTPAIPLANATVLSFSQMKDEYEKDLRREFALPPTSMIIPEEVKSNVEQGMKLKAEYNKGVTPVSLSFAKYLLSEKYISIDKLRRAHTYFEKHSKKVFSAESDGENIDYLLWGGNAGRSWVSDLVSQLEKLEQEKVEYAGKELITFPYKSMKDANPALRGISPPITVEQANAIAKQADSIGTDGEKNGWAIAISSFKKTHAVEDGKWVKKNTEEMEMSMDEEKKLTEEMAAPPKEDTAKSEEKETPAEEKAETKEEQKKEEEKGIEKKFEFTKNFNMEKMSALFSEDEEEEIKMAKEEAEKGEFASPAALMAGMFAKMCKMSDMLEKMAADSKVYMAENEELKKFKAEVETNQKAFAVEQMIQELSEKVIIPDEAKAEMIEEATKYTFAQLDEWRTYCKAKSFEFADKETNSKSDVVRVGMPFTVSTPKKSDDLRS